MLLSISTDEVKNILLHRKLYAPAYCWQCWLGPWVNEMLASYIYFLSSFDCEFLVGLEIGSRGGGGNVGRRIAVPVSVEIAIYGGSLCASLVNLYTFRPAECSRLPVSVLCLGPKRNTQHQA